MARLEASVSRLEALSARSQPPIPQGYSEDVSADPATSGFNDLIENHVRRVAVAAEKIGGEVHEATMILEEAFSTQKVLLVTIKQCQVGFRSVRSVLFAMRMCGIDVESTGLVV